MYLAGGFGSYLDPESAMAIGMLPRACAGKLHTLGNTALAGAAVGDALEVTVRREGRQTTITVTLRERSGEMALTDMV